MTRRGQLDGDGGLAIVSIFVIGTVSAVSVYWYTTRSWYNPIRPGQLDLKCAGNCGLLEITPPLVLLVLLTALLISPVAIFPREPYRGDDE